MNIEAPRFAAKTSKQLKDQITNASQYAEELFDTPLIPPHLSTSKKLNSLVSMDRMDLYTGFPARMEIYGEIIQAQKQGIDIDEEKKVKYGKILQTLNSLDLYINSHISQSKSERTLRERQFSVFEDLRNFLERGNTEGYIKLPTGVGKTVLFAEFVEATDLKSLIVVPTIDLVKQTEEKFNQFAPELRVGKVFRGEKDYSRKVTITTYQSLVQQMKTGKIKPEEYDLLILDEAHQSLGKERAHAVSQFENAFKIGFTATPKYSKDRQVKNILNNEVHTMSIKEASEERLLSPFRVWLVNTDVDLSKVTIDSNGNYDVKALEEKINIEMRNKAAVELYEQQLYGQSALAFCVSVKHAQDVASLFNERGIKAAAVYGGMDQDERDEILTQFKNGEISVLCNMQVLTEGFDAPNSSVCLNLRPILSPVVAEQRGGRVLRLDPQNPHKESIIIDFIDQEERMGKQPISFAEVAGTSSTVTAPIFNQVDTQRNNQHAEKNKSEPKEEFSFKLGDFDVIFDVKEVMRIADTMKDERDIPDTFFRLPLSELALEYQIHEVTMRERVREILQKSKDYYRGGGGGGKPYYITIEALDYIRRQLNSRLHDESTEKQYNLQDTAKLLHSDPKTLRKMIESLSKDFPDHFSGGGSRWNPYCITDIGVNLLKDSFHKYTGSDFNQIPNTALAKEFNISSRTVRDRLYEIMDVYPNLFKGGGGPNKPYLATDEGLNILREVLLNRYKK
jgi:superfamily II DNA or RNA helicase